MRFLVIPSPEAFFLVWYLNLSCGFGCPINTEAL